MTEENKRKAAKMRQAGRSYGRIARDLDIPVSTVKSFCRRHKVPYQEITENRCLVCGEPVMQLPGHKEKKFCSDRCRNKWWNSHLSGIKREAMEEYSCPVCGKIFYAYPKRNRKYCSHECYIKGRYETVI